MTSQTKNGLTKNGQTQAGQTKKVLRLQTDHPIIQGPFGGGLSTVALAATVSNLGGLGSFGAHILSPDEIISTTEQIRHETSGPFALNLWISDHDPGGLDLGPAEIERWFPIFETIFDDLGLAAPEPPESVTHRYDDQIEALLEARPPAFSFVFGIPTPRVLEECRRRGIMTIGAATTLPEALALDAAGVDAIIATGFEAGGHRPAFLDEAELSLVGTFALTQIVSARVSAPVIAAGGIVDADGVRAAMSLGAQAAQIGTAFLATQESGASQVHRDALFGADAETTTLTRSYTGRLARGIPNRLVAEVEARGMTPPFPVQAWFVSKVKSAAKEAGLADLTPLYAGQAAPNIRHRTAPDLMRALVDGLAEPIAA